MDVAKQWPDELKSECTRILAILPWKNRLKAELQPAPTTSENAE